MRHIATFLISAAMLCAVKVQAQNRVEHNGQNLFLNGLNLAWGEYPDPSDGVSFANDIGPDVRTPNTNHFDDVFIQMEANGANIMRLWLHTTGAITPAWSGSTVTGPGTDTITDLQTILDVAWEHKIGMMLCLWSFDMLRMSNGATINDRAEDILTIPAFRNTYVTNALIPMVSSLAGHPAIIAWEIFNEPEGMSDEFGWNFNRHVPMSDIQAFINVCAGAIHRTDPTAKVTNGSWSFDASTDVDGWFNYYTDARLISAGGDADGTLDFYCTHYYDWAGTGRSPFLNPASHWALDKPLVIAEFFPDCANCTATPHDSLYTNGYAGAISWSWTDSSHATMLSEINDVAMKHPGDILINLAGAPTASITSPTNGQIFASGTNVLISADAIDTNGTVTKVEFFDGATKLGEDTSTPYAYNWLSPSAGARTLKVVVTDDELFSTTSPFVTIQVGIPPSVTLTAPTNGATYASGGIVAMAATASDTDGTISKVKFFQGAIEVGEDTASPYQFNWSPADGNYQITAMATDDSGLADVSSVANITVGTPMPPTRLEAEDAAFTGAVAIESDAGASGGEYLDMAGNSSGETITWSVNNVPSSGTFDMTIGYSLSYDSPKTQNVIVNGVPQSAVLFSDTQDVWLESTVSIPLNAGNNAVQITASWGYMWFDYIEFEFDGPGGPSNTPPVLTVSADNVVNAGLSLSLTNSATDTDTPPQLLLYSMQSGPTNANVNLFSGLFTWRPPVSQADSINPITVVVTDNGAPSMSDTGVFTVTVNPLTDPVVSSIDISGGQTSIHVTGDAGPDYSLLTTTNMQDWGVLYTTNSPTLPVLMVDTNLTMDPFRAYGIGLGP